MLGAGFWASAGAMPNAAARVSAIVVLLICIGSSSVRRARIEPLVGAVACEALASFRSCFVPRVIRANDVAVLGAPQSTGSLCPRDDQRPATIGSVVAGAPRYRYRLELPSRDRPYARYSGPIGLSSRKNAEADFSVPVGLPGTIGRPSRPASSDSPAYSPFRNGSGASL